MALYSKKKFEAGMRRYELLGIASRILLKKEFENSKKRRAEEMNINLDSVCKRDIIEQKDKSFKHSMILMLILIFVTIIVFAAQTYAYFTDGVQSNENRISAGKLDMELVEMQNGDSLQISDIDSIKMMPATSVSKTVRVKNTGSLPIYIRIKIEKTINKPENEMPDGWEELIICNFNVAEGPWIYHEGYYYYKVSLDAGSTTAQLFDTISFSKDMGNQFEDSEIAFTVICQATQANGNSDSPMTAWGWPSEADASAQTN